MPAVGGTTVCCRDITARAIYDAIADEGVTHFGGAPIVLNTIDQRQARGPARLLPHGRGLHRRRAARAATLAAIEPLGFNVTQVYGLTETYGPVTECTWRAGTGTTCRRGTRAIKARRASDAE
jgi:fatty-acyl-CoA synthase